LHAPDCGGLHIDAIVQIFGWALATVLTVTSTY